jgi:hypothetical protein
MVQALRRIVRAALRTAEERVYPRWRGLGYHDPEAGYLCGIFPAGGAVRLYFEHGRVLPDPDRLFTRRLAQTAYVEVRDAAPRRPALMRLLRDARAARLLERAAAPRVKTKSPARRRGGAAP